MNIFDTKNTKTQRLQTEIDRLKGINVDLVEALDGLLAHLWDGRKRNVKKDYSLMVAEVVAQEAIRKAKE
jgi:uncharacterized protein HemX